MNSWIKNKLKEGLLAEKDNRRVLIDKLGVSEDIANWAHGLSDKLSIWIVKTLKDKYASDMKRVGPEDQVSLDDYYKTKVGDYEDIMAMLKKPNKPKTDINTLTFDGALDLVGKYRYIEAWLDDPANQAQAEHGAGFLTNRTWDEAVAMADAWHNSLTAGGEVEDLLDDKDEIIHTFSDGFMWVLRRSNTCPKSRESMGHCATATKPNMYLLRLVKGNSEFVTVDWDPKDKFVVQLKGLNNKKPIAKYHPYIVWLIRNWGGIDRLMTDTGYLPNTNFQLGDLDPEVAAELIGNNPKIQNIEKVLDFTPNDKKAKLIAGLFKYDSFLNKLIPNGFYHFFNMVENKNQVIGAVLKSPTFLERMNEYSGYLTDTIERMLANTTRKDEVIDILLKRDGLIGMLDGEGEDVLIDNHSNPDYVRNKLYQADFGDDMEGDEMEISEELYESKKRKIIILTELRKTIK